MNEPMVDRSGPKWQPIETAPKGGGAESVTDPAWVEPPRILLALEDGGMAIAYWDWYYAEGGNGYTDGRAWIDANSGEVLSHIAPNPTHWMPLPAPPEDVREARDARKADAS